MVLTGRFDEALRYATIAHAGQVRKCTGVPYLAHLLGVASIVLEEGGNEDEAVGALLHDAAEDAGGEGRLADIRCRFGAAVAEIVKGCTDAVVIPKPPWRERKEKYIDHLPKANSSTRLVSAADKLYNARAILRDYRECGDSLWDRFNGGKAGTLWYYRALAQEFLANGPKGLAEELDRTVREIEYLADSKK